MWQQDLEQTKKQLFGLNLDPGPDLESAKQNAVYVQHFVLFSKQTQTSRARLCLSRSPAMREEWGALACPIYLHTFKHKDMKVRACEACTYAAQDHKTMNMLPVDKSCRDRIFFALAIHKP